MKIDHDYMNAHIGQKARKMNETVDQKKKGGAGYLASLFGFTIMCENAHPATYGAGRVQVM